MKLGLGELEQADSQGYSRQFTQTRFLIIAEKIQPQILIDARDGPYPLFRDLLNTIPPDELDEFCANLDTGWRWLQSVAGAKAFLDSLLLWSRRWNIEADWCIERTILAMRRYFGIKGLQGDFSFFYPLYKTEPTEDGEKYLDKIDLIFENPILETLSVYDFSPPSPSFSPPSPPAGLPAWKPYRYPLKEGYLLRIEIEARERLENDPYLSIVERSHRESYVRQVKEVAAEYADRVKAYYHSQAALRQVKVKHKLKTHLEWTVLVWVLGKSFNEVAGSAEPKGNGKRPTWKAVKKAVKEILELIEPAWSTRFDEMFPPGGQRKVSFKSKFPAVNSLGSSD